MKRCSRCKEPKETTQFYRNRIRPDGLQVWCKLCVREHQSKIRAENPQKYQQYQKDWFARHPGYFRRYSRKRLPGKGKPMVVFENEA